MSEPTYTDIAAVLNSTGLPCTYSHFRDVPGVEPQEPPFLTYIGRGQSQFEADNTYYHKRNRYQIEYYFRKKDESKEDAIETALLNAGFLYDKSEDVYLSDLDVFLIYYYV